MDQASGKDREACAVFDARAASDGKSPEGASARRESDGSAARNSRRDAAPIDGDDELLLLASTSC